jgi:hypothetical protein
MLRIIAQRAGYCDWFGHLRMDKVLVTAFTATLDEAPLLKLRDFSLTLGGTRQLFFYVA